ncbi:hypothetical protein [Eubacterium sp.]
MINYVVCVFEWYKQYRYIINLSLKDSLGLTYRLRLSRLPCEQTCYAGDGWGPHGQKIGQFDDTKAADDFEVEYIKVYQNSNYEQYIQDDSEFDGSVDLN